MNDDAILLLLYAAPGLAVVSLAAWVADQFAHVRALRRYHRRPAAATYRRPDGAPLDY